MSLHSLIERDASAQRERRIFGLVTARVTSMHDDGTFELAYLSMGSDDPSAPARAMMPMAGANRGAHFLPEPGDEVVVAFEHGDTNLPIILGGVWNEDSQPPSQASTPPDNHVRTLVSRSGHEVTLDDSPGQGKVTVKTKGGHELVLDDTPPGKVTLKSQGGCEIELSDAGGILTLKAPLALNLEAPTIALKSSASMSVQAPAGIQLTTTGSVTASAVVIDGKPFGLHTHTPPVVPPLGSTGPVTP